jgi:hypothetical protein
LSMIEHFLEGHVLIGGKWVQMCHMHNVAEHVCSGRGLTHCLGCECLRLEVER